MIGDTRVKVKAAYIPVTESNCSQIEAMNLLMFLVKYSTYKKAVAEYLLSEHIYLDRLDLLLGQYPNTVIDVFNGLYK